MTELKPENLNEVSGGTSPILPGKDKNGFTTLDQVPGQNGTAEATDLPEVIAYCRTCGSLMNYLGQTREGGGNTGEFKCSNPLCIEFDKIKFNDDVTFL